jgi:Lrp/AsnC family transcriptional regulator, regulator for asnA, asnC and gidA
MALRDDDPGQLAATLDDTDWQIIRACRYMPKISNAAIAREIGSSEATVRRRLRTLADAGVLRFATLVHPSVMEDNVKVLVGVKITPTKVLDVADTIAAMPDVRYAALTTGPYDLWLASSFPSATAWLRFRARLHELEGVLDTETFQVAHLLKRTWDWLTPEDRVGDGEDPAADQNGAT